MLTIILAALLAFIFIHEDGASGVWFVPYECATTTLRDDK